MRAAPVPRASREAAQACATQRSVGPATRASPCPQCAPLQSARRSPQRRSRRSTLCDMSLSSLSAWARKAASSASKPWPATSISDSNGIGSGRARARSSHHLRSTRRVPGSATRGSCIGVMSAAALNGLAAPRRARCSDTTAPPIECASTKSGPRRPACWRLCCTMPTNCSRSSTRWSNWSIWPSVAFSGSSISRVEKP